MDINKGALAAVLGIAASASALIAGYKFFTSEKEPVKSVHKSRS